MHQGRRKINGFTAVELTATIVVISIIGAVVVAPLAYDSDRVKLDAEVKRLLTDVRYVQSLSMFRNARYRLDLKSSAGSYRILTPSGGTYNYLAAGGTTVHLEPNTSFSPAPNTYLVFNGLGEPALSNTSNGNGTPITSTYTLTLSQHGSTETVTILPYTGLVSSS